MGAEIQIETDSEVYRPAEDSFLFIKHAAKLKGRILEVGCGTGIVSLYCAASDSENTVEGVDINPAAVSLAQRNAELNRIKNVKFYESDLFSNVKGKYDWIIFNPPYLPTSQNEKIKGELNNAFDGGQKGREIMEKFIERAPRHLEKNGGVLLLVSNLSGKEEITGKFESVGLKAKIIDEEALFFEKLYVISAFFNSFQTR